MAWFGVGSGSRRAKPERAQRFVQADRVVVEAFADLHEARLPPLHEKQAPHSLCGACSLEVMRSAAGC